MNTYARLRDVLRDAGEVTANDAYLAQFRSFLVAASREVRDHTGTEFAAVKATKYVRQDRASETGRLWIPWAVSLTSVAGLGDGTYSDAYVENTDFYAGPENRDEHEPIKWLEVTTRASSLSWPTEQRGLRLVGVFGYSNEVELTGATLNEALDTSETAVAVLGAEHLDLGETVRVDSEDFWVDAIHNSGNVTLTRGVNGTTAATHESGAAIYRRRYPRKIEQATRMRAIAHHQATVTGGQQASAQFGGFQSRELYAMYLDLLGPPFRQRGFI